MERRAVESGAVIEDPNNRNLTIPRSYGVYEIFKTTVTGKGRKYRYGNHSIRMKELEREYGKVALIALFLTRNDAKEYSATLNL